MLEVRGLTKNYGDLEVLKGIDFEINEGSIYGFLGRNGAGKTTTMNILTGLIEFNKGSIKYNNIDFKENKREILQMIGYVPQDPVFYGYMNAFEYLNFIGKLSGMNNKEIKSRSEEVLSVVGLFEAAGRKVGGYSGGMQQRFAIAVALFNKPKMLFLDEPTSSLDPQGRMEILELIREMKQQGMTIFFSTHILNDIERICDQVSILEKGKILVSGDLSALKEKYIMPIYDIELEKPCPALTLRLESMPWIDRVCEDKNRLTVYVKDIGASKKELLKNMAEVDCAVLSYNLRKSDLEDIFIRLVSSNENL
ncbi:MAG: ATP-binding cassette domain-containing protein [Bacillota bacterium]